MIADSMTYDDILKLYWEDKKLVNHKIEAGNKFYSRMLIKARRERKKITIIKYAQKLRAK